MKNKKAQILADWGDRSETKTKGKTEGQGIKEGGKVPVYENLKQVNSCIWKQGKSLRHLVGKLSMT